MATDNFTTIENVLQETLGAQNLPREVEENLRKLQGLVKTEKQRFGGILGKFRLDGQVALVTGGSRGIGYAMAEALGEAGCKVAIASVNFDNAQAAAEKLREKGIETLALQVEVAAKDSVDRMVQTVLDTWGDLHIGVNNAGVCLRGQGEEFPEEDYDRLMGINVKGVFLCCQAEARHMLTKGYGRIINLASMSATIANRPQTHAIYNTSKAAVVHMTRCLAVEWAGKGITVNAISPGYIETDMTQGEHLTEVRKEWLHYIPAKRIGEVEELTGITLLLASSLSSYQTGSEVIVDGGYVCW